jgi:hypothetical protein
VHAVVSGPRCSHQWSALCGQHNVAHTSRCPVTCSYVCMPPTPHPQMLSNMRYHTSVIISLFGAMGTLGSSSRKLMKLGAYADRIRDMERVMADIRAHGGATGGRGLSQCSTVFWHLSIFLQRHSPTPACSSSALACRAPPPPPCCLLQAAWAPLRVSCCPAKTRLCSRGRWW